MIKAEKASQKQKRKEEKKSAKADAEAKAEQSDENLEDLINSDNSTEKIVDDYSLDDFDERK